MPNDGQIVFEVTADGSRAKADIRDITKTIQQETDKWDDAAQESANNINNSFSGMLKKLAVGFSAAKIGKELLDLGKQAISAASDLAEVQNVVDTTFGAEGAAKIEQWAKAAGTQFGLTETQAKKFTSTLGAMMKSSGMAGEEIVSMSTDLAGLAADMASFYNLDFDEAFQKIRSGISGETEPLKQLGINMSVANLNAYALQQGLEKTFEQMDQGEQTMLRYQYIMSATADAQGDFAKTSDQYANGVRSLETNIETLKTNVGTLLLEVVDPLVQGINSLFPQENTKRHTVLDDIAEIQLQTEAKLEEIKAIKSVADELISTLESIGSDKNASGQLSSLAESANTLDASSKGNWESLLTSLQGIDGLQNLFGDQSNAVSTVQDLAGALAGDGVSTTKAKAWQTFLTALTNNADAVSKLTGDSVSGTKEWLKGLAQSAGELDENDAAAWQTLMSSLLSGLTLGQSDEGKQFVESLANNFLAMGQNSAEAVAGLTALGYGTDEIQSKQMQWLEVCKQLVNTIPGLSDIIDTNTGEVKGGVPAIKAYADEWERVQEYQAKIESLSKKKKIFEDITDPSELGATAMSYRAVAKGRAQASQDSETVESKLNKLKGYMTHLAQGEAYIKGVELEGQDTFDEFIALAKGASDALSGMGSMAQETYRTDYGWDVLEWFSNLDDKTQKAVEDYLKAEFDYQDALFYRPLALQEYEDSLESLAAEYNMTTQQLEDAVNAENASAESMTEVEKAAKGDAEALTDVETAVNNVSDAFKELADYAENSYNAALKAVDGVAKSLDRVSYQSFGNLYNKMNDLITKQAEFKEGSDEWKQYQSEIDKLNQELVTTDTILSNLGTQSTFLDDYLANLRIAQSWGLSDALLAQLSDGSVESAQYLSALVGFGTEQDKKTAEEIDKQYQEVQKKKEELAKGLSDQQLTVDQTFQSLAEKAKQAVQELDLQQSAETNAEKTVSGIVKGISSQLPAVTDAVDGILEQMARLASFGISTGTVGGIGQMAGSIASWFMGIPGFESGLDIVPIDNMLARLHKGEAVLTAEENRVWQSFRSGLTAGVDMETLGGVMRDNVKAGGNVYLDGRVVGSVISDQQGKSYRQLQRSGWQV